MCIYDCKVDKNTQEYVLWKARLVARGDQTVYLRDYMYMATRIRGWSSIPRGVSSWLCARHVVYSAQVQMSRRRTFMHFSSQGLRGIDAAAEGV